jgi:hypothetical protein
MASKDFSPVSGVVNDTEQRMSTLEQQQQQSLFATSSLNSSDEEECMSSDEFMFNGHAMNNTDEDEEEDEEDDSNENSFHSGPRADDPVGEWYKHIIFDQWRRQGQEQMETSTIFSNATMAPPLFQESLFSTSPIGSGSSSSSSNHSVDEREVDRKTAKWDMWLTQNHKKTVDKAISFITAALVREMTPAMKSLYKSYSEPHLDRLRQDILTRLCGEMRNFYYRVYAAQCTLEDEVVHGIKYETVAYDDHVRRYAKVYEIEEDTMIQFTEALFRPWRRGRKKSMLSPRMTAFFERETQHVKWIRQ